jgi:hypothetical protein
VFAEIDAGDAYLRILDSKTHHAQRKDFVLLDNIINQVREECWTSEVAETIMSTHMYNVNDLLSDILLPLVNKKLNNFPGKTSIILSDWKTATDPINVAPSFALYEFCTRLDFGSCLRTATGLVTNILSSSCLHRYAHALLRTHLVSLVKFASAQAIAGLICLMGWWTLCLTCAFSGGG